MRNDNGLKLIALCAVALVVGTEDSLSGRLCWHSGRAAAAVFFVHYAPWE